MGMATKSFFSLLPHIYDNDRQTDISVYQVIAYTYAYKAVVQSKRINFLHRKIALVLFTELIC